MALYTQSPQDTIPPRQNIPWWSKPSGYAEKISSLMNRLGQYSTQQATQLGDFINSSQGIVDETQIPKKDITKTKKVVPDFSNQLAKIMSYQSPVVQTQVESPVVNANLSGILGGVGINPSISGSVTGNAVSGGPVINQGVQPTQPGIGGGVPKQPIVPQIRIPNISKVDLIKEDLIGTPRDKTLATKPDYQAPTEEVIGAPPLNAADLYKMGLDKAVKAGNLVNLAEAGMNIANIIRAANTPTSEDLEAPEFDTPHLTSPSRYLMQAQLDQMDLVGNASRKALVESGREDLLVGLSANEIAERNKIAAGGAMADVETTNENLRLEAEARNREAIARAETDKYNITKQIQENMMIGNTISEAISNLDEIGRQYVNRMTEAEFNKWYADILQDQMSMQQIYNRG